MNSQIADLLAKTKPDPWRLKVGFTPEVQVALHEISTGCELVVVNTLNKWLSKNQPCLFGRIAAKRNLLSYCVLREDDLRASEDHLRNKIHAAHLEWTRLGFDGMASGFIIAVVSEKLALAEPDEIVRDIALKICSLYIDQPVEVDRIYHDELWLRQPGKMEATWVWPAGINYFSAQGDGRWWQDHRFPAGIAFSVNSVGHMAKSGKLIQAIHDLEELMGTETAEFKTPVVDSLEKALELAMRTIDLATKTSSGPATWLTPFPADRAGLPACPVQFSGRLADMNYCDYLGKYHTDYTIPSEYFFPLVETSPRLQEHLLDLTYIFHRSTENPDFFRMGEGRRIRASGPVKGPVSDVKQGQLAVREVLVSQVPRLLKALGLHE